ncbi:MAG: hypothetical protein ACETVR_02490 [Candidatus Bathyarchaeia archaeon]
MFTRSFLVGVRRKALRRRVWWRALDRVERAIVDLTIRVVDRVRSEALGIEIVKALKKLRDALKTPFVRLMETHGVERARRLSQQALAWGHRGAEGWGHDFGFIKYLTVIETNNPLGFGQL